MTCIKPLEGVPAAALLSHTLIEFGSPPLSVPIWYRIRADRDWDRPSIDRAWETSPAHRATPLPTLGTLLPPPEAAAAAAAWAAATAWLIPAVRASTTLCSMPWMVTLTLLVIQPGIWVKCAVPAIPPPANAP